MQPDRALPQEPASGVHPTRRLEPLATIGELAKEAGCSTWTMRRRLRRLHARHPGPWLVKEGDGAHSPWRVNRTLLKLACPHLFGRTVADPKDVEELTARVREVEKRQGAMAAKFRQQSFAWMTRASTVKGDEGQE